MCYRNIITTTLLCFLPDWKQDILFFKIQWLWLWLWLWYFESSRLANAAPRRGSERCLSEHGHASDPISESLDASDATMKLSSKHWSLKTNDSLLTIHKRRKQKGIQSSRKMYTDLPIDVLPESSVQSQLWTCDQTYLTTADRAGIDSEARSPERDGAFLA